MRGPQDRMMANPAYAVYERFPMASEILDKKMDGVEIKTQHPDPERLCCDSLRASLEMNCQTHDDPFECPDSLIAYHEGLNQFALIVHDGARDVVLIKHCPWCGRAFSDLAHGNDSAAGD